MDDTSAYNWYKILLRLVISCFRKKNLQQKKIANFSDHWFVNCEELWGMQWKLQGPFYTAHVCRACTICREQKSKTTDCFLLRMVSGIQSCACQRTPSLRNSCHNGLQAFYTTTLIINTSPFTPPFGLVFTMLRQNVASLNVSPRPGDVHRIPTRLIIQ
jgi:hypothetical protein